MKQLRIQVFPLPHFYKLDTEKVSESDLKLYPDNILELVLCQVGEHQTEDWGTFGIVYKQTPYGQDSYLGFNFNWLCEATPTEIINAVNTPNTTVEDFYSPHPLYWSEHNKIVGALCSLDRGEIELKDFCNIIQSSGSVQQEIYNKFWKPIMEAQTKAILESPK